MTEDSILDRARKLLALAQHPNTPAAEAENAERAAERLITKYAIDTALLHKDDPKITPVVRTVDVEAPFAKAKATLLTFIARAYDCQVILTSDGSSDKVQRCKIVGFESDLDVVDLLFTSLLLQATTGLHRAFVEGRAARRAFLLGFATRVGERLAEVRKKEEALGEPGTALVLANRADNVKAKMSEEFPRVRTMRTTYSDAGAARAGRRAGDEANLSTGSGSIGGRKGALTK